MSKLNFYAPHERIVHMDFISGGYTECKLKSAIKSGQIKIFIYREKGEDGKVKTIQGGND